MNNAFSFNFVLVCAFPVIYYLFFADATSMGSLLFVLIIVTAAIFMEIQNHEKKQKLN